MSSNKKPFVPYYLEPTNKEKSIVAKKLEQKAKEAKLSKMKKTNSSSKSTNSENFASVQDSQECDKEDFKTSINEGGEIELSNKTQKKDKFRKIK